MIGNARSFLAAALVLLAASVTPAAAQQRECPPDDGSRVGWLPPEAVDDETWRTVLVGTGVVAEEAKLVRIPKEDAPRLTNRDALRRLIGGMARTYGSRIGAERLEVLILAHVGHDGAVTQALVARPSGLAEFDESARETTLQMRFAPATAGGCPIAAWVPLPIHVQNSVTPR